MKRESHGYLILGDKDKSYIWAREKAATLLGTLDDALISHPDFTKEDYDLFGIDESRRLRERAFIRPLSGEKKVFIISSREFTPEAQNALLKLFEEPPLGTHFFIITQNSRNILSTLISRLTTIKLEDKIFTENASGVSADFLSSDPSKRLFMINKMIGKKAKEEMSKGDIEDFLNNLEKILSDKIEKRDQSFVKAVESIYKSRKYLSARGMSTKLVFEYLALSLPIL